MNSNWFDTKISFNDPKTTLDIVFSVKCDFISEW